MKKFTFIFFISIYSLSSQVNNLAKVDRIIYSYSNITSIEELSKRIDYDFKTDIEKTRAIFTWISKNIYYNHKNPNEITALKTFIVLSEDDLKRKIKIDNEKTLRETFNLRTGVCKGYALLFHEICTLLNIKNELIYGYVRGSLNEVGYVPTNKNHVWNAVKINNKWMFIDTTWASGYYNNGDWQQIVDIKYFNISKEELRLTHFPVAPFWQKSINQKPLKDFCSQPIIKTAFLESKAELVLPNQGVIRAEKNKSFKINIQNLKPSTNILYRFGNNGKIKTASLTRKSEVTTVKIRGINKDNSLHLYFNNDLALSYKVLVD